MQHPRERDGSNVGVRSLTCQRKRPPVFRDVASPHHIRRRNRRERPVQNTVYDAIVVGSGISGGWAAKELTEKGLRVLMLERGKNIEHIKDYVNATKGPWEYPHRGGHTREMERHYPVLKRDYALN